MKIGGFFVVFWGFRRKLETGCNEHMGRACLSRLGDKPKK